jgi:hypothetical protein
MVPSMHPTRKVARRVSGHLLPVGTHSDLHGKTSRFTTVDNQNNLATNCFDTTSDYNPFLMQATTLLLR